MSKINGTRHDNILIGTSGGDTINGHGGNDTILGGAGNDTISGRKGNDNIQGGAGNDTLKGGDGNDIIKGGAGNDKIDGGSGTDLIDFSDASGGINFTLHHSSSYTTVDLTAIGLGIDKYKNIEGVIGTNFDDTIIGSNGHNTIFGGDGNDTLIGGNEDDIINGGAGDDKIIGGKDDDVLTGGAGKDIFVYNTVSDSKPSERDVITDFTQGDDKIDLRPLLGPTDLDFGGTTPTSHGVWFQQDVSHNRTFVFADVNGNTTPDLKIQLNGIFNLNSEDFLGVTSSKTANTAPTITSDGGKDTASVSVAENTTAVTTVTAADPDAGDTKTFSISGGDDAAQFSIDSGTGALSFKSAPDFEHPTDTGGDNVYDVNVKVTDNGSLFDTQAIAVAVTNVNEPLFTKNADTVDFNTVVAGTYINGTQYDALGGDDIVMLAANGAAAAAAGFDPTHPFHGGDGNDTITGGGLDDKIDGGDGQDTINSNAGNDQITMPVTSGDVDTINAGDGNDTLLLSGIVSEVVPGNHVVVVDLSSTTDQVVSIGGDADALTQINFENLDASGLGSSVKASGSDGDNTIIGSDGDDIINGGDGNDTLNGGLGQDNISGGAGNDSIFMDVTAGNVDTIDAGPNNDTLALYGIAGGVVTVDLSATDQVVSIGGVADNVLVQQNFENLDASFLVGSINATGSDGDNTIIGSSGDDIINGGAGNDTLNGGAGNNTLNGGSGDDTYRIDLVPGNNTINDSGSFLNGDTSIIVANGADLSGLNFERIGNDLVASLFGSSTTTVNQYSGGKVEHLQFEGGASIFGYDLGTGTYNLSSDNTSPLDGGLFFQQDVIAGSGLDEILNGVGGNDLLFGNGGADTLNGGAGADLLVGGAGSDTFVFNDTSESSANLSFSDFITDFVHGTDKIDLSGIDAITGGGDQAFAFAGNNASTVANGVTWSEDGGNTILHIDNSGNTTPDMQIILTGHDLGLTDTDFIL